MYSCNFVSHFTHIPCHTPTFYQHPRHRLSNHVFTLGDRKVFTWSNTPHWPRYHVTGPEFLVTQMLTCNLSAVANLIVIYRKCTWSRNSTDKPSESEDFIRCWNPCSESLTCDSEGFWDNSDFFLLWLLKNFCDKQATQWHDTVLLCDAIKLSWIK